MNHCIDRFAFCRPMAERLLQPVGRISATSVVVGLAILGCLLLDAPGQSQEPRPPLQGTERLTMEGDIASELVSGVDRFLLKQLDASIAQRITQWPKPHNSSPSTRDYLDAIAPLRAKYQTRIGLVDPRLPVQPWVVERRMATPSQSPNTTPEAAWSGGEILNIRWQVHPGMDAHGLMIVPKVVRWCTVLVPDAGQTPESLCGRGQHANLFAIELAERGALVVIPRVIERHREARLGRAIMTDQEYLYRSAFVLGRHLLGHHVQHCMAAIDRLKVAHPELPTTIIGWGEGGWIALATAACDPRVDAALVSGHFAPRETTWSEPIHRNVHGLLTAFGDAQLAALIAPRTLIVDAIAGPEVDIPGEGGAPGRLTGPTLEASNREAEIARSLLQPWGLSDSLVLVAPKEKPAFGTPSRESLSTLIGRLPGIDQGPIPGDTSIESALPKSWREDDIDPTLRVSVLQEWDRYQQRLLELAHIERDAHWKALDTNSLDAYKASVEPFRREFSEEIIGRWDIEKQPPHPRTRLIYDEPKWRGYEVVLDVFEDVIATGVLLIPKSDQPIVHQPCVVFQHGLEGRPSDTIVGDHPAYHDVSAKLAEEGYVVFAPQNLYLFTDRFRTLQRKSNLLGKTLFSTIVAQHEQIVRWLATRPEIDPKRIAFYGLSYGGKSAMRIPALVPEYCLSICSADFNDWVWKNASTSSPYSYVWTMEYEIFEFDLGRKFNYAEMAALIAPRPFMVERGHFDGVAPDERVALEFAKVRHLYAARLKIPERTTIEWFAGPHTIHGKGTFEFLNRYLRLSPP